MGFFVHFKLRCFLVQCTCHVYIQFQSWLPLPLLWKEFLVHKFDFTSSLSLNPFQGCDFLLPLWYDHCVDGETTHLMCLCSPLPVLLSPSQSRYHFHFPEAKGEVGLDAKLAKRQLGNLVGTSSGVFLFVYLFTFYLYCLVGLLDPFLGLFTMWHSVTKITKKLCSVRCHQLLVGQRCLLATNIGSFYWFGCVFLGFP